jgi:hypothetical protein
MISLVIGVYKLKTLVIYDSKSSKIQNHYTHEIDLVDLESYAITRHGSDFLSIPESKIQEKTVIEWFFHNDISLWWFAAPTLHQIYKESMLFVDRLLACIESDSFDKILVKGCFDKKEIIEQICNEKNLDFELSQTDFFIYSKKSKIRSLIQKNAYNKIHKTKIKKRNKTFSNSKKFKIPAQNYALITSPDIYRRTSFDYLSNQSYTKEYFISPFIDYCLQHNFPFLCIDMDYTFRGTTNHLEERLKTGYDWIPLEYFLQNNLSSKTKKHLTILKNSYKTLQKNSFEEVFRYRGFSLWSTIKPKIDNLFTLPYFPTYLQLYEEILKFLSETKPSVIIQTYEAGPYAKIIELAANNLNIPTIALQHGLILENSPDYFFNQIQTIDNPLGNIIPTKTLVFGEYYKKLLIERSAYTKSQIDVLGHPEYPDIEKIKSNVSKEQLRQSLDLYKQTVILVPLSFRFSFVSTSSDTILLTNLFENFKNSSDIIILVRPHPGDKLTKDELQKKFPSKNFFLSTNSVIEDLILSDVVVGIPLGTVIVEAAMFNKKIIFPEIFRKNQFRIDPIFQLLLDKKIAISVSSSKLFTSIIDIHNNKSNLKEKITISQNSVKFLSDTFLTDNIKKYIPL